MSSSTSDAIPFINGVNGKLKLAMSSQNEVDLTLNHQNHRLAAFCAFAYQHREDNPSRDGGAVARPHQQKKDF